MKKQVFALFALAIAVCVAASATISMAAQAEEKYTVDKAWAKLPEGMTWNSNTSSIAADGKGNILVLVRAEPYFRLFKRDGSFVKAWGEASAFVMAHSVMFDKDGFIWATDSKGHAVYKFAPDGKLVMTLGKRGTAGDNASKDAFNEPNALAIAANGDILVSDGYVNSRVVRFDKDGKFLQIIGGVKGAEPGQLALPHGVVVDSKGRVIVSDSDNKRFAVFDKDGKFVENWAFTSRGGSIITADDTVYVSDVNDGTVNMIKNGKLVDSVKGLGRPHWVTLDTDGAIYAADSTNRAVMKITKKK